MPYLYSTPYKPIWLAIIPLLILAMLSPNSTIDLQWQDSYLVLSSRYIGVGSAVYLSTVGCIYWLARRKNLVVWMTGFHVVTTITAFAIVLIYCLLFKHIITLDINVYSRLNQILYVIIALSILAQLVFVINLALRLLHQFCSSPK